MINLKEQSIENGVSTLVDDSGFKYKTTEENRGANSKVWITNAMDSNYSFETHYSYLFKTSFRRNISKDVNARNFGEVFAYKIEKALNLPHVPYFFCCFENINNQKYYGTLCPTFKSSILDVEITGLDLHNQYRKKTQDESVEINCVYTYVKQLQAVYGGRITCEQIEDVKQAMLKIALFDYVTCQTDRHWKNMGFLIPNGTDLSKFATIPLYDNEKCFIFNKSLSWIEKFANDLQKSNKSLEKMIVPLIDQLDRVPRLGIRTSTTIVSDYDTLLPKRANEGEDSCTIVFTRELAQEIHDNEELRNFYSRVKNLDIKETLKDEDAPEFLQTFACAIWDLRIAQLDKTYIQMFGENQEDNMEAQVNE